MPREQYNTEVLVIGSGGAGLEAAISAAGNGADTIIVTKGKVGATGSTIMAGEDFCADVEVDGKTACDLGFEGDPNDSKDRWFHEIILQGFYLNEQNLVWAYVQNAPHVGRELVDSKAAKSLEPGSTRGLKTTGREIVKSLRERLSDDVKIVEDTSIIDLLVSDGRIVGAVGLDTSTGNLRVFKAKAVILATGGFHYVYSVFCGSRACTGDGQSMAYRAGAELIDMEMTSTPPVIAWPLKYRGNALPIIINAITGGKAEFLDKNGRNILESIDKKVLDVVSSTEWDKLFLCRVIKKTQEQGLAGPHGGVFFSMKKVSSSSFDQAEREFPTLTKKGDLQEMVSLLRRGDSFEVAPLVEYCDGGIRIDEKCATNVSGLFAAGECTGGLWGSNRVSAATTEMLVHGLIAGQSAAEYVKVTKGAVDIDESQVARTEKKVLGFLERSVGVNPIKLRKQLQSIADEALSPIREEAQLEKAIHLVEKMRKDELPKLCVSSTKSRFFNNEWIEAIQIENMLTIVEASLRSAYERKESRGLHFRLDYPRTDNDNWLNHVVISKNTDKMKVTKGAVTVTKVQLPKGNDDYEKLIMDTIKIMREYEKFW